MVQVPSRREIRGMESHRKIAVCHLISGDLWAGAEAQAFVMMSALRSIPELQITALVLNEGKLARKLREIDIKVSVIDESKNNFTQLLTLAGKVLAENPVHIIHSHRYKENMLAALLKRRKLANALVQTVHGVQERSQGLRNLKLSLYGGLNRFVSRRYFERILAVSRDIHKTLSSEYSASQLMHIPNAVDLEQLKPTKDANQVRREFGFQENDVVIGSVGRMVPIKGFEVFLQVAARTKNEYKSAKFVLVGDGPELGKLKEMAKEKNVDDVLTFTGFRDDVLDIVNSFDIFAMTSWHEGIPIALLEAMSLSKPTVATNVGGIGEVLEPEVSGLLCPAGDVESLSQAFASLLNSRDRMIAMGSNARARVEQQFSSDILRDRLYKLYKELAIR